MEVLRCETNHEMTMDDSNEASEVGKSDPFLDIDWTYEFSAPKYFDFSCEETDAQVLAAERWFEIAIPYENSPHVAKTKSISELRSTAMGKSRGGKLEALQILAHVSPLPVSKKAPKDDAEEEFPGDRTEEFLQKSTVPDNCEEQGAEDGGGEEKIADCEKKAEDHDGEGKIADNCEENPKPHEVPRSDNCVLLEAEPCTPEGRAMTGVMENNALNRTPPSAMAALLISPGSLPTKRLYSDAWEEPLPPPAPAQDPLQQAQARSRSNNRLSFSRTGRKKTNLTNKKPPTGANSKTIKASSKTTNATSKLANESSKCYSQAEKKQKLEGGRLNQLLYVKDKLSKPKQPPALTVPHEFQLRTDERAHIQQGTDPSKASPFVSLAERVRRFHAKNSERNHVPINNSGKAQEQEKGKVKLTVAKSPAFGTSQRVRPSKVKSAAELEEEMLAKMPKFKARPLPKKILEAPALPTFTKSTPQVQEFQEFHLHTMDRAQHHATSSADNSLSTGSVQAQNVAKPRDLTKVRPPQLETANRVRTTTVKSREELEEEELAKLPKFKARPLNKMIFESKGDLGVPRNQKRMVTTPQEFHFKTDERAHSREPDSLADQIQKLSLIKPTKEEAVNLRPTKPKPFHLATDDRGLAKGMRDIQERIQHQQMEVKARIPIANLLPWTTVFPAVPPKPVPKECTKPEPFYLESLVLHEQEQERLTQERLQAEQLEAALREFHAQPNLSKAPVVLPEKQRKPLTVVEEFNLLADQRAVEREEFEKKVAEKQMQYKRYREKYEAARKAEEEKFLKAMRKEMVPTARPMPAFPPPRLPLRSTKGPTKPVSPQFSKKPLLKER